MHDMTEKIAKQTVRALFSHLYLVLLAQEQPHVGEGAGIEGVPDGVGLSVHQRPAPHEHVVLHEVHHGFGAQRGPSAHRTGGGREGCGGESGREGGTGSGILGKKNLVTSF